MLILTRSVLRITARTALNATCWLPPTSIQHLKCACIRTKPRVPGQAKV
jgi:hypothetical protein